MRRSCVAYMVLVAALLLSACNSRTSEKNEIPTDSASVAKGRELFTQNCSACHDFRQDGIGPQLGGITAATSAEWIKAFIKNPKALMDSGDERSNMLLARYKTVMPAFTHFSDQELTALTAYLHTKEAPAEMASDESGVASLSNPIPEPIQSSDLVVGAEFVSQMPATAEKGFRTRITKLGFIPGTERLFMVDIRGQLYELQNNVARLYMNIADHKPNFIDNPGLATGFGSFAFHPEFLKNGLLYTGHTEKAGSGKADFAYADSIPVAMQWVISEWTVNNPGAFPFKGKSRELFRINMVSGAHGVQEFAFDPYAKPGDKNYGLLHIGIGDGSSVQLGYPSLVGSAENALGSIFRIDPRGNDSANKQYGIPPSNPFANDDNPKVIKEIYAYGFRNPHRLSWTKSGMMLASNIGQANIESIYLIQPGHNYGWPVREGTFVFKPLVDLNKVFPLPADEASNDFTYPVAQYDHDEGVAVIGGFEYTGSLAPELKGKYIFGDMNNGRLFYLNISEIKPGALTPIREFHITVNGKPVSTAELCGSKRVDMRLGQDHDGEIYFFSKQDGKVYKFVSANTGISAR